VRLGIHAAASLKPMTRPLAVANKQHRVGGEYMPIYEYLCKTCARNFEKLQKTEATEQVSCPACGSTEVEKQLSSFSSAGASSAEGYGGG